MAGLKRHVQIVRWGKRVACSGAITSASAGSYIRVSNTAPLQCCGGGSFFMKQLGWKIRSRLKQYCLKRQQKGNAVQYSYDAKSYSQNFDSGRALERPLPFAP